MQMESVPGPPGRREPGLGPSRHDVIKYATAAGRPPFDGLTRGLHWATAIFVLVLFVTAWLHELNEENGVFGPLLLQIHRSVGVMVWMVTALRLAWRLTGARLPPFPAQMSAAHRIAVKASEYGLYALLLGQPLTGLFATLYGGRPFTLLAWKIAPLLRPDDVIGAWFHAAHAFGAWTLAIMVAGHAGMALIHHVVIGDDVLACMAPEIATPRNARSSDTGKKHDAARV
jgi:superoxide oxidase